MTRVGPFLFLAALAGLPIASAPARAADRRPVVAVFDVQTSRIKLPRSLTRMLTNLLGQELGVGGVFQVMPPGDVKRTLLEQSSESYKECYDEKCQIELGRQLPANKLVTTTIMKVAGRCRVAASLNDLKRQTTDIVAKEKCACNEAGLAPAIEKVAARLREWGGGTVADVTLPGADGPTAAHTPGDREYKRALNKAWRKLARAVRRGTTEQKLEKYQTFLVDYPVSNPYQPKVQKAIDALDAKLARQEEARRKAEEKKAALEAKRERAREIRDAYKKLKATKGSATERLRGWEEFLADYPTDNPYQKTAERKIAGLKGRAAKEAKKNRAGVAGIQWVYSKPAGIEFTKSEITVAQYRACVKGGKCAKPRHKYAKKYCNWDFSDRDRHPINCIDWNQAKAVCEWAGGRLPTVQEWKAEFSNKGRRKYPWGGEKPSCERAIWKQGGRGCGRDSTWPVCSKPAGNSVSGLCDMAGNVGEWNSSLRDKKHDRRSRRGGSWSDDRPGHLRAGTVAWLYAEDMSASSGVRCVRSSR